MKISTLNYFIVDAFKSIKRNRTISFAAMITVLITFFVFGTFTLLALNFNKSIEDVASKIQIQVYLREDIKLVDQKEIELKLLESPQVSEVKYESKDEAFLNLKENLGSNEGLLEGYDLNNNPLPSSFIVNLKDPSYAEEVAKLVDQKEIELKLMEQEQVSEVTYESKDEAFLNLKENLGSNEGLLEGYDLNNNPLPSSFIVNLKDPAAAEDVIKSVENMTGVEGIGNQQDVIDTISKFVDVVQIVGIGLFVVFVGVSVFLIMNTIKLTVYSRRREVGIMKFVGATDWFIRWPFVIEGIVIGAIGSLLSSILLYFAYNGIFRWIVSSMFIVNLVQPQFVLTTLLACFVGGGVVVGAIGSIFALRKFLIV